MIVGYASMQQLINSAITLFLSHPKKCCIHRMLPLNVITCIINGVSVLHIAILQLYASHMKLQFRYLLCGTGNRGKTVYSNQPNWP